VDTIVRTPLEVFALPQHLLVPLFQRPYVWDHENQWGPLWQDIRRLVELRIERPTVDATHFLGAVVLQAAPSQVGFVPAWSLIDGQQRLTTLQLLFDGAASAFESRGLENLTRQLETLTHNSSAYPQSDGVLLKLRHSNRDRSAYEEVMLADPPIVYEELAHESSLIVRAHRYFADHVAAWIEEKGPELTPGRATALVNVLTQSLQIVVISLRADENSQEIFETLNARGTPLTAADLIKNFTFQRLEGEGVDTKQAYKETWPFDTKFWEKEVSVGRYPVSRSSLFLNQWLISRVGEEIGPKSTFSRFKHFVEHESDVPMAELLPQIRRQADLYQGWTDKAADPHASLSAVELCVYRAQAAEIEALKPILLWLHGDPSPYSLPTVTRVIAILESWFMRRILLRLSMGETGRVVADLISSHRGLADEVLVGRVETYLRRLNAVSTYWPGDEELREGLFAEASYLRFKRPRLRMFLEAVEDHYRGYTSPNPSKTGVRVPRLGLPIEHVMPQTWASNWPVSGQDAEIDRAAHIHRMGNLTLLTRSLNSSASNGSWSGEKGKRALLEQHDVLLMNRRIHASSFNGWDEELIDARTHEIGDALIATWPVPDGHVGVVNVSTGVATDDVLVKDLVAAGLLPVGTKLRARSGDWGERFCEVLSTGEFLLDDGQKFGTPSGAGHYIRKGATNGWVFWELPDGRRLDLLRADFREGARAEPRDKRTLF